MKTCKDCVHYNVCAVMEFSAEDSKENYLKDYGCEDFIDLQSIVLTQIKPGQTVYFAYKVEHGYITKEGTVVKVLIDRDGSWILINSDILNNSNDFVGRWYSVSDFNRFFFLSKQSLDDHLKS